jgi:seryl-tRNA synthetase
MIDPEILRKDPDILRAALSKRGAPDSTDDLIAKNQHLRSLKTQWQAAQEERGQLSKTIGAFLQAADTASAEAAKARVATLKETLDTLKTQQDQAEEDFLAAWQAVPNIPLPEIPEGKDETDNVEKHRWGTPRPDQVPPHETIAEALGGYAATTAVKMSGTRFMMLTGHLARLERALGQFMLDVHTQEHGYTEVSPPYLVQAPALFGTGQLPKFEEDQFKTTTGHYLIPTAEVPLTNIVADSILKEQDLPLRFTAHTPCFRSEAGSAGRDTAGLIRLHQFHKVELVSITTPEQAPEEHERMTRCAETILERLELPYRRMLLCTGDMGFTSEKTYDLEVWMPAQQTYREISSCSRFGTFQARRMNARYKKPDSGGGTDKGVGVVNMHWVRFLNTLNGSGLAVGRTLAAVLENYYQGDQPLPLPEVLHPYMGGITHLSPAS